MLAAGSIITFAVIVAGVTTKMKFLYWRLTRPAKAGPPAEALDGPAREGVCAASAVIR